MEYLCFELKYYFKTYHWNLNNIFPSNLIFEILNRRTYIISFCESFFLEHLFAISGVIKLNDIFRPKNGDDFFFW